MGQEASLPAAAVSSEHPARGDRDDLEEQARAPPTAIHPTIVTNHHHHSNNTTTTATKGRKLLPFRQQQQHPQHDHYQHFKNDESARAMAAAGNLYNSTQNESSDHDNDVFILQKVEAGPPLYSTHHHHPQQQHQRTTHHHHHPPAAAAAAVVTTTQETTNNNNAEIILPEPKKGVGGLFPGRAKGMINTMRNLSIGGALRKQKEVQDWEKQWDEDESDDDEDDDEFDESQQEQEDDMILQANSSSTSLRSSTTLPSSATSSGNSIPPPALVAPMKRLGLSPKSASHGRGMSLPSRPTSKKATSAPTIVATTAEDLLSAPLHVASSAEWDTVPPPPPMPESIVERKPDVQMFMPMLRVLGKGSFGKVCPQPEYLLHRLFSLIFLFEKSNYITRWGFF
jgi:hypothetical protein